METLLLDLGGTRLIHCAEICGQETKRFVDNPSLPSPLTMPPQQGISPIFPSTLVTPQTGLMVVIDTTRSNYAADESLASRESVGFEKRHDVIWRRIEGRCPLVQPLSIRPLVAEVTNRVSFHDSAGISG